MKKFVGGNVWLLSELFNDKILGLSEFKKFKSRDGRSYPEVAEFAKKFGEVTKGKTDIKSFFQQAKIVFSRHF